MVYCDYYKWGIEPYAISWNKITVNYFKDGPSPQENVALSFVSSIIGTFSSEHWGCCLEGGCCPWQVVPFHMISILVGLVLHSIIEEYRIHSSLLFPVHRFLEDCILFLLSDTHINVNVLFIWFYFLKMKIWWGKYYFVIHIQLFCFLFWTAGNIIWWLLCFISIGIGIIRMAQTTYSAGVGLPRWFEKVILTSCCLCCVVDAMPF